MQKTKKVTQLLKSQCGQCGSCCREPFIELTHVDIQRLVRHTGISVDELVKLYASSDVDADEEHDWVNLSYGKRSIGLSKKRNGDCMFLSDDSRCNAYEARPMSCRLFPVNVEFDEDDKILKMELSNIITDKFVNCKRSSGKGRTYKDFISTATDAVKEYEAYCKKVDKWNDSSKKGKKKEYLDFLGFRKKK